MILQKAERSKVKLRLNIASPSGFGKTYSALLLAYGITGVWDKIAVIDTEHNSASLYSHLGDFNSLSLEPPFSPDRYIQAIKRCEDAGMVCIIIDSITHVWKGPGGLLEYQSSLGGKYQDWARTTPLYQKWLNAILHSRCHIITTNRKKQGYNMITENNRTKVEKAGLDDEIRDGYEYEMSVALEIANDNHMTRASKDRTGLFTGKPEFVITSETGKMILEWCNQGKGLSIDEVSQRINDVATLGELLNLYKEQNSELREILKPEFEKRKRQLLITQDVVTTLSNQKIISNGSSK